jgi:phosphopentomutase
VPPPRENLLPALKDEELDVVCIGKNRVDLRFDGVTEDLTAKNNEQSIDQTIKALNDSTRG